MSSIDAIEATLVSLFSTKEYSRNKENLLEELTVIFLTLTWIARHLGWQLSSSPHHSQGIRVKMPP